MKEFTADEVGGVRRASCIGGRRHSWPKETQIGGKVRARVSVNTALGRIVAIVMPTSGLAVTLVITFLAFGNTAHAACDANGFITDANGPIVLGTAGCATAS